MLKKIVGYNRCSQDLLPLYFVRQIHSASLETGHVLLESCFQLHLSFGTEENLPLSFWRSRSSLYVKKAYVAYISHHQVWDKTFHRAQIQNHIHVASYSGLLLDCFSTGVFKIRQILFLNNLKQLKLKLKTDFDHISLFIPSTTVIFILEPGFSQLKNIRNFKREISRHGKVKEMNIISKALYF